MSNRKQFLSKFLIIITLLICISCSTQNNTKTKIAKTGNQMKRLKYLHYENNDGEKGITTFYYNKNGINDKAKWELLDNTRSSDNFHTFDTHNNLIRKYREFSDGMTSDLHYIYDDNNNLIREEFSRSDGVTGITFYTNENNVRISADCNYLYGWFNGTINYVHDENGKLVSAILLNDTTEIGNISYTYDIDGNLLTEFWKFTNGFSQLFTNEYEEI